MWSGHRIKAWSTTQSALALSSGSRIVRYDKVAVQLSGVISMAKDFGVSSTGIVRSDSSSAIGVAHRGGLPTDQGAVFADPIKISRMGISNYKRYLGRTAWRHDQGCRSLGFGQVHGSARSRGHSISRSIVWRIFMSDRGWCEDPAHALANRRDAPSPVAVTRMR